MFNLILPLCGDLDAIEWLLWISTCVWRGSITFTSLLHGAVSVCPCIRCWALMMTLRQVSETQSEGFFRGCFPQAAAASPCPWMPPASLTGCHLVRKLYMDFSTSAHITALSNAKCVLSQPRQGSRATERTGREVANTRGKRKIPTKQ